MVKGPWSAKTIWIVAIAACISVAVGIGLAATPERSPRRATVPATTPSDEPTTATPPTTNAPTTSAAEAARRARLRQPNFHVHGGVISANGRYALLNTPASNMVPNDRNRCIIGYSVPIPSCGDAFVRDLITGNVEVISVSSSGRLGNEESWATGVSPTGRFVVFTSYASNLVPGDHRKDCPDEIDDVRGCRDVFVRDRAAGTTERISIGINGKEANGVSASSGISADGRFVLFTSRASNLVTNDTTRCEDPGLSESSCNDVFLYDRATRTTNLISASLTGDTGNRHSDDATMSDDGRYILFRSSATDLTAEGRPGLFLHDRVANTVSLLVAGESFTKPVISGDGRVAAFSDGNNVFIIDVPTRQVRPIADKAQTWAEGISRDGRFVSLWSTARLTGDDEDRQGDCYLLDRSTDTITLITEMRLTGDSENGPFECLVSPTGDIVAFGTMTKLVRSDTNRFADVYVWDRATQRVTRASETDR